MVNHKVDVANAPCSMSRSSTLANLFSFHFIYVSVAHHTQKTKNGNSLKNQREMAIRLPNK
jgi:hypothetical protein